MSSSINYAKYGGIQSLPAAVVFTILYVPLAAWYIRVVFGCVRRFVIALAVFCHIRIAAFAVRAALATSATAGENLNVYIAEQVLLSIGYFGLLFAVYDLVNDRTEIVEEDYFKDGTAKPRISLPIRLLRNKHLFHLIMMAAVVLGIVGITKTSDAHVSLVLRRASVGIFLALTALTTLHTLHLVRLESIDQGITYPEHASFGAKNGAPILLIIAILLLVREIFVTATLGNLKVYQNEHFWYPLVAVPEIFAVIFFLVPGLIPRK